MVEVRNIDVMTTISALEGGTIDVIKKIDAMSGTVDVNGLTVSGGTIQVNTELALNADNVTIGNVKTFADSSGTEQFGLVDSSRRIVLAPASTIVSVPSGIQDVSLVNSSGTVQVGNWVTDYIKTTGGTVSVANFPATQNVALVNTAGTTQIGNWVTDYIKTTGGTVEANVVSQPVASSGTTLAVTVTTSTVQVLPSNSSRKSFAVTGNATWYLGFGTGLTASNGFKLAADQAYTDGGVSAYTGEVWGITASGTADVRAVETS